VKADHVFCSLIILFRVVLFTQNLVVWERKLYFGKISRNLYSDLQVSCLQFNFFCSFSDICQISFPCKGLWRCEGDICRYRFWKS